MKILRCLLLFTTVFLSQLDLTAAAVESNATTSATNAPPLVATNPAPVDPLPPVDATEPAPDNNASNPDEAIGPVDRSDLWKEILYGGGYVFVSLVFLYVGKLLFDLVTPFKLDRQLTEKDNPAMGIVLTGFLLAIIVVICGVMSSEGEGGEAATLSFETFSVELVEVAAYTMGGIVLLLLTAVINDKLILNQFSNTHEVVERKNCGVAVIIAAGFIGSALIIAGAIQGSLDWISALAGFGLGQVLLIFFALVYQRATSYDDQEELHRRQNLAVGIAFAGNLLAYSLLLMKGLTMSGTDEIYTWQDQLWHFGYYALAGAIILPILRVVNDKIFLPGVSLVNEVVEDRNVNAGLLEAGLAVAMAAILIVCL